MSAHTPDISRINIAGKAREVADARYLLGLPVDSQDAAIFAQMEALDSEAGQPTRLMFKRGAEKRLAERDWVSYARLHPRPLRLHSFFEVMDRMSDREYWELLRELWPDTEFPNANRKYWLWLFSSARSGREALMDEQEHAALAALPDPCMLYRGVNDPRHHGRGMSWTTDLNTAAFFTEWLQDKNATARTILQAQVPKRRVLAYFLERENEAVIDPTRMRFEIHPMGPEEMKCRAADMRMIIAEQNKALYR